MVKTYSTIVLMEHEKIVSEDRAVADILNEYFSTITESLKIAGSNENQLFVVGISDPVTAAIEKYCYHPSVLLIKATTEVPKHVVPNGLQFQKLLSRLIASIARRPRILIVFRPRLLKIV